MTKRMPVIEREEVLDGEESGDAVFQIHRELAAKVWPNGTVLFCRRCRRSQSASVSQIAVYQQTGWPTCHGETMHVGDIETN